jgi:hypothetical protein
MTDDTPLISRIPWTGTVSLTLDIPVEFETDPGRVGEPESWLPGRLSTVPSLAT